MTPRHHDGNDEFSNLLAVCSEQLAAGATHDQLSATLRDVSPELIGRLDKAKQCLLLLEKVWPRPEQPESNLPEAIGRFRILQQLGSGGFGIVFLADDPQLSRKVALKVPHAIWLLSKDGHQHFLREAEATARLNHPQIVAVYEIGEAGPVTYIASEYCDGPSLDTWLAARTKPVQVLEAARLVAKLATAMQHAHSRGVLHRDLKPSNILLCGSSAEKWQAISAELSDLSPKIADFGLAKVVEHTRNPTRSGAVLGTLAYLAPEQAAGRVRDISAQTDVYALGAILYELLTGSSPNSGPTEAETIQRILSGEPESPRRKRPDIPRDLAAVCMKCLERAPERRYATAADLAKDPVAAMGNQFKIEATLDLVAAGRAATSDANSLLYLVKANQLANVDPGKIKAPTLVLYAPTDLIFYAPSVETEVAKIAGAQTAQLPGPNGHLNGVFAVAQAGDKIRAFLAK